MGCKVSRKRNVIQVRLATPFNAPLRYSAACFFFHHQIQMLCMWCARGAFLLLSLLPCARERHTPHRMARQQKESDAVWKENWRTWHNEGHTVCFQLKCRRCVCVTNQHCETAPFPIGWPKTNGMKKNDRVKSEFKSSRRLVFAAEFSTTDPLNELNTYRKEIAQMIEHKRPPSVFFLHILILNSFYRKLKKTIWFKSLFLSVWNAFLLRFLVYIFPLNNSNGDQR